MFSLKEKSNFLAKLQQRTAYEILLCDRSSREDSDQQQSLLRGTAYVRGRVIFSLFRYHGSIQLRAFVLSGRTALARSSLSSIFL